MCVFNLMLYSCYIVIPFLTVCIVPLPHLSSEVSALELVQLPYFMCTVAHSSSHTLPSTARFLYPALFEFSAHADLTNNEFPQSEDIVVARRQHVWTVLHITYISYSCWERFFSVLTPQFFPMSLRWEHQWASLCALMRKVCTRRTETKHFSPFDPKPVFAEKVSDRRELLPHPVAIAAHHPIPDQEEYGYQGDDQQHNSPVEVQDTCRYHYGNEAWNKFSINMIISNKADIIFSHQNNSHIFLLFPALLPLVKNTAGGVSTEYRDENWTHPQMANLTYGWLWWWWHLKKCYM